MFAAKDPPARERQACDIWDDSVHSSLLRATSGLRQQCDTPAGDRENRSTIKRLKVQTFTSLSTLELF
jgi:hypothetical protein